MNTIKMETKRKLKKLATDCINSMKKDVHMKLKRYKDLGGDMNIMVTKTTLLCEACHHNNMEAVKYILETGGDINKCDHSGCSPLYIAASHGHRDLVVYLMTFDVLINTKNKTGFSALMSAVQNDHSSCAMALINNSADVNIKRPNTLGVDMDLLTYVLFAKGDINLALAIIRAGAAPKVLSAPLGFILLEDVGTKLDFFQELYLSGFNLAGARSWVQVTKVRMDTCEESLTSDRLELLDYIDYTTKNAFKLQDLARISVRTIIINSRTEHMHFQDKIKSLPLPKTLLQYVAMDYI